MTTSTDIAPVSFDSRQFRATMGKFATGVTIVTTYHEGQSHGMTANSFLSVSLDPPLVLVSVATRARLRALLAPGCQYGVSVLADDQEALSRHFAGRPIEGLHIPFVWKHGVPLIDNALAHVIARVVDAHPAGDHTLYIGEVEYLANRDGSPLLFFAGKYGRMETISDAGTEGPFWYLW